MRSKTKWLAGLLVCGTAVLGAAAEMRVDSNEHEWTINHSDNGKEFNLRIKGKPEFTEDYSDLKSLSPGGSVMIEEKTPAGSRKLEIKAGADGQLQRTYSVNGAAREID